MEGLMRAKMELESKSIEAVATKVVDELIKRGGIKNDISSDLTVEDIAKETKMSKSKTYAMLKEKNVDFYLFGTSKRYARKDVDEFKKECKVKKT
ncbi:helix-turn-helix domain-containing protein [Enterococcus faecalis]|nr:helix-turn-helix domain-containing protein [Enterococcus faecalis]